MFWIIVNCYIVQPLLFFLYSLFFLLYFLTNICFVFIYGILYFIIYFLLYKFFFKKTVGMIDTINGIRNKPKISLPLAYINSFLFLHCSCFFNRSLVFYIKIYKIKFILMVSYNLWKFFCYKNNLWFQQVFLKGRFSSCWNLPLYISVYIYIYIYYILISFSFLLLLFLFQVYIYIYIYYAW